MQLTHLILMSLLASFPRSPAARCLEQRHDAIVRDATAASAAHGVPVEILLATGFLETHLGCDRGEGGGWGAPISRTRRHAAGNAGNSASALALGYRRCGSSFGAVSHYRCGMCRCNRLVGYRPEAVIRRISALRLQPGAPAVNRSVPATRERPGT
jgi:hypothetical protein